MGELLLYLMVTVPYGSCNSLDARMGHGKVMEHWSSAVMHPQSAARLSIICGGRDIVAISFFAGRSPKRCSIQVVLSIIVYTLLALYTLCIGRLPCLCL